MACMRSWVPYAVCTTKGNVKKVKKYKYSFGVGSAVLVKNLLSKCKALGSVGRKAKFLQWDLKYGRQMKS